MSTEQTVILSAVISALSNLFLFLSGLAAVIYNIQIHNLHRAQDQAARQEVATKAAEAVSSAKEVAALSATVAAKTAAVTAQSAAANIEALNSVHAAVLVVGDKADASYKEANNVNLKIQSIEDSVKLAVEGKK